MPITLFISDLHLAPTTPQLNQLFLKFINEIAPQAEALYILGDFFEAWIGDDTDNAFTQSIQTALQQLQQKGVKIYVMSGNRDFLLGKKFVEKCGAQVLSDPTVITLYGTSTLLMHGDSLCIDDHAHQRFRKITQSTILRRIFLALPLSLREKIAQKIRCKSEQRQQQLTQAMAEVNQEAVVAALQHYQTTQLIHGHTHQAKKLTFTAQEKTYRRIVLGAWHDQEGNYLQCSSNQKMELKHVTIQHLTE